MKESVLTSFPKCTAQEQRWGVTVCQNWSLSRWFTSKVFMTLILYVVARSKAASKPFFCLLARLLLSTLITDIADISRYMQYWYQYKQRLIIMEESSSSCILYCGTNPPKSKGIFSVRKFLTVLTVWKVNCLRSKHLWFNLVICSTPNKAIHNNEIRIYGEKNQTLQI